MKKILTFVYLILFVLIIFSLQVLVIDQKTLLGVKPNLILISVIVASLWFGLYIGSTYAFIVGIICDMLFGNNIGMFTISYTIIGIIIGFVSYNYRKENKITLILVIFISTIIFEIIEYFIYFIAFKAYTNILFIAYQALLTSIFNIIIVFIVYSILYKIVSFFDNRFNTYDW